MKSVTREQFLTLLLDNGAQIDPARFPPRQRDYPALQNYPANMVGTVSPSCRGAKVQVQWPLQQLHGLAGRS
ncbi:hypothetical protein GJ744_008492 [Endocarpon pusillum]|uniref:Uncharacterized protein n=1 Tax=Endocarpon pusillum TaxID=364733 RepID=A0A8H7AKU6_9EURO|nr:hypothetical protein GJ744_008492 [Endocarpon pusillum]